MNPQLARTTTRKSGVNPPPFAAHGFWRMLILLLAFGMFVVLLIGRLATLALFEGNNGHNNNLIMRTLLTALLLPGAKGFYLPGVNPYSFFEGEA